MKTVRAICKLTQLQVTFIFLLNFTTSIGRRMIIFAKILNSKVFKMHLHNHKKLQNYKILKKKLPFTIPSPPVAAVPDAGFAITKL